LGLKQLLNNIGEEQIKSMVNRDTGTKRMMNATKDVKHQTPGNESMNIFANQDVTIADDIEKM